MKKKFKNKKKNKKHINNYFLPISIIILFLIGMYLYINQYTSYAVLRYGNSIPQGFGVPWNLFSNQHENIIDSSNNNIITRGTYIYRYGYIYANNQWQRFEFPQEKVYTNWIRNEASFNVNNLNLNPGEYWFIAYTCSYINNEWKCGCRTNNCRYNANERRWIDGGMWQIQRIDTTRITMQAQSLREAGIELALPSYLPENLKYPQKLFSGREIRIPLTTAMDIKKMRLELESQTQPKLILNPKDKTLDLLKEIRQEPPEFRSNKVDFKIPEDIATGTYNLKLFSENQELKNVNIQIQGLTPAETTYKRHIFDDIGHPSVVSRIERRLCISDDEMGCVWETVLSGDHGGPGIVLVSGGKEVIRSFGDWRRDFINFLFFRNELPFYYFGDPKVEVFNGRFYLAANVRLNPGGWVNLNTLPKGGALYIGCIVDSLTCRSETHLFKDFPRSINDYEPDYSKIAIDKQNNIIYISSLLLENNRPITNAIFVSRDSGNRFQEIILEPRGAYRGLDVVNNIGFIKDLDVGSDGKLYAAMVSTNGIDTLRFNPSGELEIVRTIKNLELERMLYNPAISSASFRLWYVDLGPKIAADNSQGPYRGRIYIIWAEPDEVINDRRFEYEFRAVNFDIFLSYSDDQGETWSRPIKINDDRGQGEQYFPSIDVDGNGIVSVAFLDHRNEQDAAQFDVYFAYSIDGGRTFSRNLRVNRRPIPNPFGGRAWGDYFDLVHGRTGEGMSYVGYPCVDDSYNPNEPLNIVDYKIICIDQIDTGAIVPRR